MDRLAGHDGRDRVLVDQLRMTVTPQQDAEIVEPRDNPLQLDPIDEEDRQGRLVLADVIEKGVLEALCTFSSHGSFSFLLFLF
jgi:hypothetical protein